MASPALRTPSKGKTCSLPVFQGKPEVMFYAFKRYSEGWGSCEGCVKLREALRIHFKRIKTSLPFSPEKPKVWVFCLRKVF